MATLSANPSRVPQTGPSFQRTTERPVHFTSYSEAANNPSVIAREERSFYYNQSRYRHIRPPKSPLYIPAVLRPTERPARQSTAPPGVESNHDFVTSPVEQRNSAEASRLGRVVNDEWNEGALGKVTGSPTKNHWKPDASAQICDLASCERPFSFFSRRHHCRRCGNIFCGDHSHQLVPLDQHARFHPAGSRHRACDRCWADFRMWEHARTNRSNSNSSQGSGSSTRPRPVGTPNTTPKSPEGTQKKGGLAESLPEQWHWSTF